MAKLRIPVSAEDHQAGNRQAGVVLVEYGDYQCPHCGIAHPLLKNLLQEFGDRMLFVFRNFPIREAHPAALPAALAAEAAGLQGKFWEMHDLIYENQDALYELGESGLEPFAKKLGLDIGKFDRDGKAKDLLQRVEKDFEGGIRSGVNGTPGFFINGSRLTSYDASYESLADAVRGLL